MDSNYDFDINVPQHLILLVNGNNIKIGTNLSLMADNNNNNEILNIHVRPSLCYTVLSKCGLTCKGKYLSVLFL